MNQIGTTAAQPTATPQPAVTPAASTSWFPSLSLSTLVPANAILVIVGILLGLGALLISQKETVVQVAGTAARVGAAVA